MTTEVVSRDRDGAGRGPPREELRTFGLSNGARLFVYPTERFKTSVVNILLRRPLDTDTAAAALLPFVLRRGTRRLPDMAAIARRLEHLFGASLEVDVTRLGETQVLMLRAEVVEDRYLFMGGRGLLAQVFALLRDVLFDPALEGECFAERVFVQERLNLRRFVEGLSNDKTRYAFDRCVRLMCEGEPYARIEYGDPEEIEAVGPSDLLRIWREVRDRASAEVYVVTSTDPPEVLDMAEECLHGLGSARPDPPDAGEAARRPRRIRRVRETAEVTQARMVMGYRSPRCVGRPSYPLAVWNTVFGGAPYSRLFREVRERASLAYYCSSSVDHLKGVAFVQAGIEAGAAPRVERIVGRQLADLRAGRIAEEELENAKEHLRGEVLGCADSPSRIAGFLIEQQALGGVWSFAEAVAEIGRVTIAEVVDASREIRPDMVYLLAEGGR
ncbi:MAG: insulinase family protein [Planctomycetes bacterium]|nr:insulinase family protein [Planctomycetota bacterium]